jgi:very-short-patch-repair endonuclease
MPTEIVEVTAVRHLRRHARNVVWHESFHLTERDVTELDGIPVTRPMRTFLDLAVVLDPKPLEQVLNDGMHRNLLSIPAIWRRWEQLGPLRHGAGKVRALLERYTADERPTESVLETLYFQLLRENGIATPTKQLVMRGVGRIDFAYPDLKVSIELDGGRFHSSREAQERDRAKSNDLVAAGWRVLRFTWDDVTKRPDQVLALMRGA